MDIIWWLLDIIAIVLYNIGTMKTDTSRQDAMVQLVNAYLTPEERHEETQKNRAKWRESWRRWAAANPGVVKQRAKLRQQYILEVAGVCCIECGRLDGLEIHHIDGDPTNDSPDNIEVRCVQHHRDLLDGVHSSYTRPPA